MNRVAAGLAVSILLVVQGSSAGAEGSGSGDRSQVIPIGAVLALTGNAASFGKRALEGFQMAQQASSARSKVRLVLNVEDSGGRPASALSSARKLIDIEHVNVILSADRSDCFLSIAPIAEQKKVLLFSSVAGAESVTRAGDYVFRNQEGNLAHGAAAASFLGKRGVSTAITLTAQASNALSFTVGFRQEFERNGGRIVASQVYPSEMSDFQSMLAAALRSKPEAVYIAPNLGSDAGLIVRQLRALAYRGLIVSGLPAESPEFLEAAGRAAEGVIVPSPAFDRQATSVQPFLRRFQAVYGTDPDWVSAYAYDAWNLVASAIEACQGDSPGCLRDFLYHTQNYPGVGGITSFDQNGDVSKPLLIKVVADGRFRKLQ